MRIDPRVLAFSVMLLVLVAGALGEEQIFMCEEDAFICSDDWANDNYGNPDRGYSPRAVGHQNEFTGEQIGRQLYRFAIPPGITQTTSAQLYIKVYDNFAGNPVETSVLGLADEWQEMVVTWNTQPLPDSDILDTELAYCCGIVYVYDVTAYVQSQLTQGDHTICFQQRKLDEATIGGVRWFQREGEGVVTNGIRGESPELHLEVDVPSDIKAASSWGMIKSLFGVE